MNARFVVDMFEIKNHPTPIPTCAQVADTLRRVFIPLGVECPENVIYMPVPRCESCAHWRRTAEGFTSGVCNLEQNNADSYVRLTDIGDAIDPKMETLEHFGCVQWKER